MAHAEKGCLMQRMAVSYSDTSPDMELVPCTAVLVLADDGPTLQFFCTKPLNHTNPPMVGEMRKHRATVLDVGVIQTSRQVEITWRTD